MLPRFRFLNLYADSNVTKSTKYTEPFHWKKLSQVNPCNVTWHVTSLFITLRHPYSCHLTIMQVDLRFAGFNIFYAQETGLIGRSQKPCPHSIRYHDLVLFLDNSLHATLEFLYQAQNSKDSSSVSIPQTKEVYTSLCVVIGLSKHQHKLNHIRFHYAK